MKRHNIAILLATLSALLGVLIGCHAKPDDPAGQAEELSDPVRRENAIANLQQLYSQALAKAGSDRSVQTVTGDDGQQKPGPKAIADASIEALTQTYIDHPEDSQNGRRILDLLDEMQDPRALPAFTKALEWRAEVTEEHAIRAAQAIERMEVPEDQKGTVIEALSTALDRIQGGRGVDNRMRIHMIRALGALEDRRATPILTKVATRLSEDQNFLINRMAAEEVGALQDPAAVPSMIKSLFLFAPNRPDMRMNDVAAQALVRIGQPAYEPLLQLLRGESEEANRIATNYISAVRRRNEEAASKMDPRSLVMEEACFTLGLLGRPDAFDPMLEQVQPLTEMSVRDANAGGEELRQRYGRALSCTTSLVRINRTEAQTPRLRQALTDIYARIPEEWPPEAPGASRSQLLAAMAHTYDPGLMDFLYGIAADREGLPDFRVVAVRSYAQLANREEAARIRQVIEAEPAGVVRTQFDLMVPALDTAQECHEDLSCYIGKLDDDNAKVVEKAASMIARYGRGNDQALEALVPKIGHDETEVRGAVLYAIDWVATDGSPEAVAEIDRIREAGEGTSAWNQVKSVAMELRARLQARASEGG